MKDDRDKKLHEALDLVNSEKSEVFIEELTRSVGETMARSKGEDEAFVESAIELDAGEKAQIENILFKLFKRVVKVNYYLKQQLLGGFKITIGDWKLDATLAHEISSMKKSLRS